MEELMRICKACLKEKSLKFFYKNAARGDGYDVKCKNCKREGKKVFREVKPKKLSTRKNAFGLHKPSKEDYKNMYLFLKDMGYTPNKVHEEFCWKYNLPEKYRSQKNQNLFTAQDFEL